VKSVMYTVLKNLLSGDVNTAFHDYMEYNQPHNHNIVELFLEHGAKINNEIMYNYIGENMDINSWNQLVKHGAVITEIMIHKYLKCKNISLMILDSMVRNCEVYSENFIIDCIEIVHDVEVLKILLQKNFNPSALNKNGENCLHVCHRKSYEIIKLLLKRGVDPHHENQHGYTAIDMILQGDFKFNGDYRKMMQLLLKYRTEFRARSVARYCNEENMDLLKTLLSHVPLNESVLNSYLTCQIPEHKKVQLLCENIRRVDVNMLETYLIENDTYDIEIIYTLIQYNCDINYAYEYDDYALNYIEDEDIISRLIYTYTLRDGISFYHPIYEVYCRGELPIAHPHLYPPLKNIARTLLQVFKRYRITRHIAYIVLQRLFYNL
jgi:ankyrin repeat protein